MGLSDREYMRERGAVSLKKPRVGWWARFRFWLWRLLAER